MDRIVYGLEVTAIATALVAGTLSILALSMFLLKKLAFRLQSRKSASSARPQAEKATTGSSVSTASAVSSELRAFTAPGELTASTVSAGSSSEGISSGVIAVITATVAAHLKRPTHEIRVRSVSRPTYPEMAEAPLVASPLVSSPFVAAGASQWARAGRQERLFGRQRFTL